MSRMPPGPRLSSRPTRPPSADLLLGAGLHGAQRAEGVGVEGVGPQPALRGLEPPRAQLAVAGDGAGLQQRLELPRLGPAVPVGLVGVDRANQRSVAALGSEVGVDPEAAAGDLHHRPGPSLEAVARSLAHEHHVDVAGVVELGAAELPHPHHGQANAAGAVPVAGRGQLARRGQDPAAEGGQVGAHHLEGDGTRPGRARRCAASRGPATRRGPRPTRRRPVAGCQGRRAPRGPRGAGPPRPGSASGWRRAPPRWRRPAPGRRPARRGRRTGRPPAARVRPGPRRAPRSARRAARGCRGSPGVPRRLRLFGRAVAPVVFRDAHDPRRPGPTEPRRG